MTETTDPLDTPLPCEVRINHIRFSKGVPLRTLVDAATRWHTQARDAHLAKHPVGDVTEYQQHD